MTEGIKEKTLKTTLNEPAPTTPEWFTFPGKIINFSYHRSYTHPRGMVELNGQVECRLSKWCKGMRWTDKSWRISKTESQLNSRSINKTQRNWKYRASPGGSAVENLPANAGVVGLISGLRRPPGEWNSNPFHYSCLGNPMDRAAWWATIHGVSNELDT